MNKGAISTIAIAMVLGGAYLVGGFTGFGIALIALGILTLMGLAKT